MNKNTINNLACWIFLTIFFASGAQATNGLNSHGNGMISSGMGGAGIADAREPMSAMDNPALATGVAGWSAGVTLFNPHRFGDIGNGYVESDSDLFIIPQGGRIWELNSQTSAGVLVNVMGGLAMDYPPEMFGVQTSVNLANVVIAPSIGYVVSDKVSIGASLLVGFQYLTTNGPGVGGLPRNDDSESAFGGGLRIGLSTELTPTTTLGLTAQTQLNFEDMDVHCQNLFANAPDCAADLPSAYGAGIKQLVGEKWKLLADVKRVNWGDVPLMRDLFGWINHTVYAIGAEVTVSEKTAFRFGYNHGDSPIPDEVINLNVLSPAVTEDHFTVGFTRKKGRGEISGYFSYMPNNEQVQAGAAIPRVKVEQYGVGLSYSVPL